MFLYLLNGSFFVGQAMLQHEASNADARQPLTHLITLVRNREKPVPSSRGHDHCHARGLLFRRQIEGEGRIVNDETRNSLFPVGSTLSGIPALDSDPGAPLAHRRMDGGSPAVAAAASSRTPMDDFWEHCFSFTLPIT